MTGTPEEERGDRTQQPPLPGPVDETQPPMTIIGGPQAQDSPSWRPTETPAQGSTPSAQTPEPSASHSDGSSNLISGVFSAIKRQGRWVCPAELSLAGAFSEAVLDFREAEVTSPEVRLNVYDIFSSCKIIVPPGVGVDLAGGVSIMSAEKSEADSLVSGDSYRLRIQRYGLCSDIKVVTLAVGESEPKWWKR